MARLRYVKPISRSLIADHMDRFLVTGASGQIGSRVATQLTSALADRGKAPPRLLLRRSECLPMPPGAECVWGDFDDLDSMARAFEGVRSVFLYTPAHTDPGLLTLAAQKGVRHVVLPSSASVARVAPGTNPIAERHRRAEQAVIDAGLEWTFLRPDILASNCLSWSNSIIQEGLVRVPYPESRRNPLHEDDVAAVACAALLRDELRSSTLLLTGPSVLTIRQQVMALAEVTGMPLRCVSISEAEALQAMSRSQPQLSTEAATRLLAYQRKMVAIEPETTQAVLRVMGRPARTFAHWAQDHVADFQPPRK